MGCRSQSELKLQDFSDWQLLALLYTEVRKLWGLSVVWVTWVETLELISFIELLVNLFTIHYEAVKMEPDASQFCPKPGKRQQTQTAIQKTPVSTQQKNTAGCQTLL